MKLHAFGLFAALMVVAGDSDADGEPLPPPPIQPPEHEERVGDGEPLPPPPIRPPVPQMIKPARPTAPPTRLRVDARAGVAVDRFFNLDFRRLDFAFAIGIPYRGAVLEPSLHVQPGETPNGLQSNRTELGLAIRNDARVRVAAGLHLTHTMVLRKSVDKPLFEAIFGGDIAGLGIGPHVVFSGDLIRFTSSAALTVSVRGMVEVFDDGVAYGAGANLGFGFGAL